MSDIKINRNVRGKIIVKNNTNMSNFEIKKQIYKQEPIAEFKFILANTAYYTTNIKIGDTNCMINFLIPITDMGGAKFENKMEAKHLIRWII